jgi:hypothetical protein
MSRLALFAYRLKWASTWASSPWSTIGCVQNDLWAYGTFSANRAPILHRHYHCLQTDWSEIPHDPHHLGVPLGASKTIYAPIVHSSQTVHLSCIKISTVCKQTKLSFHLSLVTLEYHRVHPKWFLSLWYVWDKPCTYLAPPLTLLPNGPKRDFTWPTSPRRSIECVQTVHLSCIIISTISKRTKSNFHSCLIT